MTEFCIWCNSREHSVSRCAEFAAIPLRGTRSDVGTRVNMLRMMNGQLMRFCAEKGLVIPQRILDMNPDRVAC